MGSSFRPQNFQDNLDKYQIIAGGLNSKKFLGQGGRGLPPWVCWAGKPVSSIERARG
jgi:hypothetical protein